MPCSENSTFSSSLKLAEGPVHQNEGRHWWLIFQEDIVSSSCHVFNYILRSWCICSKPKKRLKNIGPLVNMSLIASKNEGSIKEQKKPSMRCKWVAQSVFHNLALFFPKLLSLYKFLHFGGKPPIKCSNKAECFSLTNMLKKRRRMQKGTACQYETTTLQTFKTVAGRWLWKRWWLLRARTIFVLAYSMPRDRISIKLELAFS